MSYQNVKDFRSRLKERAVYVMGGHCVCCGYDRCQTALEFHHLDPTQKDYQISNSNNSSWAAVRNELPKTVLVCANCHREIHAGLIDSVSLSSSFDEERAKEIDTKVEEVKSHKIYYCKYCGKEVWAGNDRCPECAALMRRKAERPSREELKDDIRNNSMVSVGKKYGVTDNAIRKWCKAYNLPSKKIEIDGYSDTEWELI